MQTLTHDLVVIITRAVSLSWVDDDGPRVKGDKLPNRRAWREARLVALTLGYRWDNSTREWVASTFLRGVMEQRRANDTWGPGRTCSVYAGDNAEIVALIEQHKPTTLIDVSELALD